MAASTGCGILMGKLALTSARGTMSKMNIAFTLVALLAAIYAALFLHIIIHEGGHFVCGKISGYRLASFRI